MQWEAKAHQRPWEWHRWYAWHPVRIPGDIYEPGRRVWLEPVWRKVQSGYAGSIYHYALHLPEDV